MKNAVGYIRVSTLEQAKDGFSIRAQREKINAYAIAKDMCLDNIYIDDGYSGSNLNRPGIKEVISNIKNINCVLVYKLDRLSRSQKEVLYLVEDVFLKNDVDFISINETFDTSTSYGRAMIGMLAVFSQFERENIIQRTVLGKEQRAKEGGFSGGVPPLGYNYRDNTLTIDSHQDKVIQEIYRLYISGYGYNSISKHLQKLKILGRRGGKITPSKVKTIIGNPIYTGYIPYKGINYQGNHEPIISKAVYDRAQDISAYRKSISKSTIQKNNKLFRSGLLRCGICGANIFKRRVNNKDYYTCYSYHGSPSHMVKSTNCNLGLHLKCDVDRYVVNELLSQDLSKLLSNEHIGFTLHDIWQDASFMEKQQIVNGLINDIHIFKNNIKISFS